MGGRQAAGLLRDNGEHARSGVGVEVDDEARIFGPSLFAIVASGDHGFVELHEQGQPMIGYDEVLEAVHGLDALAVEKYLKGGVDPNAPRGEVGVTPMQMICQWGAYDPDAAVPILDLVLEYGGDINYVGRPPNEITPPLELALDTMGFLLADEERVEVWWESPELAAALDWRFLEVVLARGAVPTTQHRTSDGRIWDAYREAASYGRPLLLEFTARCEAEQPGTGQRHP